MELSLAEYTRYAKIHYHNINYYSTINIVARFKILADELKCYIILILHIFNISIIIFLIFCSLFGKSYIILYRRYN